MTEAEWLSGTDPLAMVNAVADRLTDRKLRLYLVACCRRLWHLPAGPGLWNAAEAAERFADGACGQEEMERAARAAHGQGGGAVFVACLPPGYLGDRIGTFVGRYMRGSYRVMRGVDAAAEAAARHAVSASEGDRDGRFAQALADERAEQCRLLRDVVGDPFRPAELDPSWLAWDGGTVLNIATWAYEERAFDQLPLLADALEDAGCTDAETLGHLRCEGPHVRGCWVLDLLLGKG